MEQSLNKEQWKSSRGEDKRSNDYFLSMNMAKQFGMVERTEQGHLNGLEIIN